MKFASRCTAVLTVVCTWRAVVASCFYPDGTLSQDVQCKSEGTHSMCCRAGTQCLNNGVCKDRKFIDSKNQVLDTYSRGSCSDTTWSDPACVRECLSDSPDSQAALIICTGASSSERSFYCYDKNGVNDGKCQDRNDTFTLTGGIGVMVSIPAKGASTSVLAPAVVTLATTRSTNNTRTSPTISPMPEATSSTLLSHDVTNVLGPSTHSKSVVISAAVGGSIGLLALVLLIYIWLRYHKQRHRSLKKWKRGSESSFDMHAKLNTEIEGSERYEMSSDERVETDGFQRYELPTSPVGRKENDQALPSISPR